MSRFVYRGSKTRVISFPLGGIGTGCIGLAGDGRFIDWEIANRPAKGHTIRQGVQCSQARGGGKRPIRAQYS